jgi:hypothetical protein
MGFTSSVQLARAEPRSGSVIPAFVVLNDGRGLCCRKEKWFADESGIDVWRLPDAQKPRRERMDSERNVPLHKKNRKALRQYRDVL